MTQPTLTDTTEAGLRRAKNDGRVDYLYPSSVRRHCPYEAGSLEAAAYAWGREEAKADLEAGRFVYPANSFGE